jgi:hypothetical protein
LLEGNKTCAKQHYQRIYGVIIVLAAATSLLINIIASWSDFLLAYVTPRRAKIN